MALRAVVSRAKPWAWVSRCHQTFKGEFGFLGAISGGAKSFFGPNLFNSPSLAYHNPSRRRDNGLPPVPVEYPTGPECLGRVFSVTNHKQAFASAEFAVTQHNETQGRHIRFQRVVRASRMVVVAGYDYYLTLQGIDENGDLHIYYAEVRHCTVQKTKQLRKWQLVDESFSYPFQLVSERERTDVPLWKYCGHNWVILRAFLPTVSLKYKEHTGHTTFEESNHGMCVGNPDLPRKTMNSDGNVLHITDSSSPVSSDDIEPLHSRTAASADVVPVYNMIHCGRVVYHALSAVRMFKQKEGKKVYLQKVLHASKEQVDGKVFYNLLLQVRNDKEEFSFLHASLEVSQFKEELIKCHAVVELSSGPLGKKPVSVGASRVS